MSSLASLGLVNGCSSVATPGPDTRAVGTGRGPSTNLASTKVWPPAHLPSATHLALQLLDELLEPVDLCHPLAIVFNTNTCTGKGRELSPKKLAFITAKACLRLR